MNKMPQNHGAFFILERDTVRENVMKRRYYGETVIRKRSDSGFK